MRALLPVIPAALAASLAAAPAGAGNWTLGGSLVERLQADTNLRLRQDNEGPLFGASTGVDLDLGYDARRTVWSLGSGARLRGFVGPGDAGGLGGLSDPRLRGGVVHRGKADEIQAAFDVLRRPVAFTVADETGQTEGEGTETRLGADAGWTRRLSARDTASLGFNVDVREFSEEAESFTPSTSVGATGRWGRLLDARTGGGISLSLRRFDADGPLTDTRTDVATLAADVSRQLTRRHSVSLSAGIGRTWTDRTIDLDPFTFETSDSGVNFSGSAAFDWAGTEGTSFSFTAARALESTAEGRLQNTTRLGARISRVLTPRITAALAASATRRSSEAGSDDFDVDRDEEVDVDADFLSIGPRLEVDLTRVWNAGIGADFRLRRDDDGSARSAGIFVELRRAFVLNR